MTFRHDTSFPYFAIAMHFDVPYGQVLAIADRLDSLDAESRLCLWLARHPDGEDALYNAVHHAWHAENARRAAVSNGSPV